MVEEKRAAVVKKNAKQARVCLKKKHTNHECMQNTKTQICRKTSAHPYAHTNHTHTQHKQFKCAYKPHAHTAHATHTYKLHAHIAHTNPRTHRTHTNHKHTYKTNNPSVGRNKKKKKTDRKAHLAVYVATQISTIAATIFMARVALPYLIIFVAGIRGGARPAHMGLRV